MSLNIRDLSSRTGLSLRQVVLASRALKLRTLDLSETPCSALWLTTPRSNCETISAYSYLFEGSTLRVCPACAARAVKAKHTWQNVERLFYIK